VVAMRRERKRERRPSPGTPPDICRHHSRFRRAEFYAGPPPRSHEVAVEVTAGHLFVTVRTTEQAMSGDGLRPAVAKLLEVLVASDVPLTQAQVVDGVSALHGHGLRRETVSRGLGELLKLGLADKLEDYPPRWMAVAAGVTT